MWSSENKNNFFLCKKNNEKQAKQEEFEKIEKNENLEIKKI